MLQAAYYFLRFLVILGREVVLATIAVTKLVLGPAGRVRSGFVAIPLAADTDLEVTVLANSITLTPGTITVYVNPTYDLLVVHAIDIGDDVDELRRVTKDVLESNILRWTRRLPSPAPASRTGGNQP
jgi:multisubunit Na+/H+ antiporter MnhE subunit